MKAPELALRALAGLCVICSVCRKHRLYEEDIKLVQEQLSLGSSRSA